MRQEPNGLHREGEQGEVWGLLRYADREKLNLADLIRVPYVQGGRDPKTGLDCTGLKIEFWRRLGVEISDPWETHCTVEGEFKEVINREFGDSLCIDTQGGGYEDHVAIYLGLGLCIHVHQARGVEVIPVRHLEGKIISVLRKTELA